MAENPSNNLVFVALGANLPAVGLSSLQATLEAGIAALEAAGCAIAARSGWWRSAAWPPPKAGEAAQPDYLNGVVALRTGLEADALLARLHAIEAEFGRHRQGRWDARPLDLDLLDYAGKVQTEAAPGRAVLPHPRMASRLFVLLPLREVAPAWRHPVSGLGIEALVVAAEPIEINRLGENSK